MNFIIREGSSNDIEKIIEVCVRLGRSYNLAGGNPA